MSKFKFYVASGVALVLVALAFLLYAANNPQDSFPWSNTVTYGAYGLLTGLVWGLAFKHRRDMK